MCPGGAAGSWGSSASKRPEHGQRIASDSREGRSCLPGGRAFAAAPDRRTILGSRVRTSGVTLIDSWVEQGHASSPGALIATLFTPL